MSSTSLRILNRPIVNILNDHLIDYPTPININYMWNFGSLAGIFLGVQILTGIFLAMHYTPHVDLAFLSVEHIMRDVNNGWLIRYLHANGASMFFLVVSFVLNLAPILRVVAQSLGILQRTRFVEEMFSRSGLDWLAERGGVYHWPTPEGSLDRGFVIDQ